MRPKATAYKCLVNPLTSVNSTLGVEKAHRRGTAQNQWANKKSYRHLKASHGPCHQQRPIRCLHRKVHGCWIRCRHHLMALTNKIHGMIICDHIWPVYGDTWQLTEPMFGTEAWRAKWKKYQFICKASLRSSRSSPAPPKAPERSP